MDAFSRVGRGLQAPPHQATEGLNLGYLTTAWLSLAIFFAVLWIISVRRKDASHVDVGWAAGLGFLGVVIALSSSGLPARRTLVGLMALAWSARLAFHLYLDRVKGKPEDGRYAALRASWGTHADRNFFFLFQAQAVLDMILASSFLAAARAVGPLGLLDLIAASLWMASITAEAVADRQLAAFRADPANKGQVCRVGVWNWSRHPNYFFEWLVWLSYAAMAPGTPLAWISPALMLFFLLRVTGIPATEAQALKSRGDAYRRYQKEVPMFIPRPPWRIA